VRGQRGELEGERRTVTVLFADAVGSTRLAERLGEEGMYGVIQGCVERMVEAVRHYEGHLAHFTGDGVMAVFGAPVAHEESERRAVAAALRMQRALEEYAGEVRDRHGVECHYRVGLHTGPVVVGSVCGALDMDFTAIGDTVNLAARMQQVAEPGSVYLTGTTHRAVAAHVECEALGALMVKGKPEPVEVWRAVRERRPRSRFEVATERGLAPFVGREEELLALERHLARVEQGRGQVVFLSGEPGIGKSRLLLEFRRGLAGLDVRWLQGSCSAYGTSTPYLPVIDLVKRAIGVEEDDSEARVIERLQQATAGWPESVRATIPYLRYLLSVDPGDDRVQRMDPRERRAGILEGLRGLILEESSVAPLVVAIEDLHWLDESSQTALGALVDLVPSVRVLLILTHRPGGAQALARAHTARLALDHLAEEESAALVRGVLGTESLPPDLGHAVVAKAEGNPFFTEEVVHSLVDTGVLIRRDTGYVLTRALADVHIPDTIQEVILSRIDRLERPARGALVLASVIGREFTVRLLGRISDLDAKLDDTLERLKILELINETAFFPELAYMFKHALTHDVAYSTLLVERRRSLHRQVAAAVEELYAGRLAEHYETLAHHYYEGQGWEKALEYLALAGRKAAATFANQDALDHYARALDVCQMLGDATLRTQADIAHRRAYVSFGIGRFTEAIGDMDRVIAAARRLGDHHLEGTGLAYRGYVEMYAHRGTAESTLLGALALPGDDMVAVKVLASLYLALVYEIYDRHAEARPLLEYVSDHAPRLDAFGRATWGYFASLDALWAGRLDTALRRAEEGMPAAEGTMSVRLLAQWNHAHALATGGEYQSALRLLDEALALSERVGDITLPGRCLNTVGWVYGELQDPERALDWNLRALDTARASPAPVPEVRCSTSPRTCTHSIASTRPRSGLARWSVWCGTRRRWSGCAGAMRNASFTAVVSCGSPAGIPRERWPAPVSAGRGPNGAAVARTSSRRAGSRARSMWPRAASRRPMRSSRPPWNWRGRWAVLNRSGGRLPLWAICGRRRDAPGRRGTRTSMLFRSSREWHPDSMTNGSAGPFSGPTTCDASDEPPRRPVTRSGRTT
jgi:class 3 adenylate cyclase/tetratricopeptide (TPR) repeat protein